MAIGGEEVGDYGTPRYLRTLSADEEAAVAHLTPEIALTAEEEALNTALIARTVWFTTARNAESVEAMEALIPLRKGGDDSPAGERGEAGRLET